MNNETSELENKPENKNMCKRGCGFYGSVRFKDMCSKCYQEHIKCSSTLEQATLVHSTSIDIPDNRKSQLLDCCEHSPKDSTSNQSDPTTSSQLSRALKRKANPSVSAETSKGFACRCDGLFCSLHRYSDQHECAYDYQANGRLELARANPEVRCPKIRKL
ncbi:AN1-type zinc finger protein 5, variant 2 [Schistosoma haematobium]|uniref:AN1-type zinc finger protein 5, variant 2 n=1 Tax=Schistosoma haematobium TaxID=6185 RepID=A0A922LZY6_SCHHA|nr:AN1-type zinc finger protein 5, variant 2 [Schistosoma haematobium]KAH9596814.1 AN1-type zinc finger protein 5, variant 2 [Schistosoma haematobium]